MKKKHKLGKVVFGLTELATVSLLVSGQAQALELAAPFNLETAQVLPGGVRNPRYVNLFMSVGSKFGGTGQVEALGDRLNKTVTWNDVVNAQPTAAERNLVRSTLNDAQYNMNGTPGSTTGQVNTFFNVKVPIFAVGLSERFTLAVAMPIMNIDVNADTGFSKSPQGQRWVDRISTRSVEQGNVAANKLNNSVNEKLTSLGYQPVTSKTISGIGDVQVVGKYLLHKSDTHAFSVKSALVLPTGIAANPDAALDIPTGDGRYQVGGTLVYDRNLPSDFRWNSYGGMLALASNTMTKRLPTSAVDSLSADKEILTRNWGRLYTLGTSMSHQFPNLGLTAGAGYTFQYLTKTRYSNGSLYSADRYSYLEGLTPAQLLHSATLMAGFSSVEWYQNKKFVYPFQANIVFSHPLGGRNVSTSDVVSGELVLFF